MDVYSGRLKWKDYKEKDLLILSIFLSLQVQQYGYIWILVIMVLHRLYINYHDS